MENFKNTIPDYVIRILSDLESNGFDAYVVGGCVRDYLLSHPTNDWDVCTSALPEKVKATLSDFHTVDTGISHGTVTAVIDGNTCEITTFRREEGYSDHRHPDSVSFTSKIEDDLKRRDFTVNAMAFSLKNGFFDPFSGKDDLDNKLIRCVGNPYDRFDEDALRIIRALRFSSCLGFEIEKETASAISELFPSLEFVANERISAELRRLLCGDMATDIMTKFLPVFEFIFKTEITPLTERTSFSKNFFIRLSHILSHLSPQTAADILHELKFDNQTIKTVCFLLENKDLKLCNDKIETKKLLSAFGREKLYLLSDFLLFKESSAYKKQAEKLPVITLSELDISGNDLISEGIAPGKAISTLLSLALMSVLEEKCPNIKQDLLKYIL